MVLQERPEQQLQRNILNIIWKHGHFCPCFFAPDFTVRDIKTTDYDEKTTDYDMFNTKREKADILMKSE
jgi:hypothetical protein